MRPSIHALTLALALSAAVPSFASTLSVSGANNPLAPAMPSGGTGVDGPLAPATDYTLPYRADGIFDFSAIDLGAGITLRFDPQMRHVALRSQDDILIAGVIDASGLDLSMETPGDIFVTGAISADTLSLVANTLSLLGTITSTHATPPVPLPGGNIPLRGPGTISLTVPEPPTPWLVVALLPLLMLFGRKHTSYGR